jgi:pimeloyl-ACP methyl ester carboxylesterase
MVRMRMKRVILLCLFASLPWSWVAGQRVEPAKIHANGVDLRFIEQGRGEPLILLHGGQGDYRSWGPQMATFSTSYRVISYSRRYNYPNNNPLTTSYRLGYTDADDLAAFIHQLRLGRVHLVGTSAGAMAALVLATEHPELVRSLVLAEPPIHRWAKDDAAGRRLYTEFIATIWDPAAAAFKAGDDEAAMRILADGFGGAGRFDALAPEARAVAMQNARFFKAATSSPDPFPDLPREKVRLLKMPILIVTGANTIGLHRFVNEELARLLPRAEHVTIPNAGHGSPRENPQVFNESVARFLRGHSR